MITIKLARDTMVKLAAGTIIEVPEEEAKRLFALKNAVEYRKAEKPEKPEQKTKKK